MMLVCSECGTQNLDGAERCIKCKFPFNGEWTSLVGVTIGNYQLTERIGGGGFGAVYKALHVTLKKPVAVKILHPNLASESSFQERFQKEAFVLAELQHENVIQVFDFGFDERVGFYLFTEWLEGKTLHQVKRYYPQPEWGWIWSLFSQLLDAVAYAHDRGIIHRDLKPENMILIQGSRNRSVLKIVDFGIAELLDQRYQVSPPNGESKDKKKYTVGTPYYMAPEQVRGDISNIGPHTDVYACGIILAELLTGQRVFDAPTPREIMKLHLIAEPPSLKELDPEREYPEKLENVVKKALAKDIRERYRTATEFFRELDEAFKESNVSLITKDIYPVPPKENTVKPTKKERPKIEYRFIKKNSNEKWLWLFVGAIFFAVGISLGVFLIKNKTPHHKKRRRIKSWSIPKKTVPPLNIPSEEVVQNSDSADASEYIDTLPEIEPLPPEPSKNELPPEPLESPDTKLLPPHQRTLKQTKEKRKRTKSKRKKNKIKNKKKLTKKISKKSEKKNALIPITFNSSPQSATVIIGKKVVGKTPVSIKLPKNRKIKVSIKKKGFISQTITITTDKSKTVKVKLVESLFED